MVIVFSVIINWNQVSVNEGDVYVPMAKKLLDIKNVYSHSVFFGSFEVPERVKLDLL